MQAQLSREIGEAGNIKSRQTRHTVIDSLTAALTAARSVKATPPNGLAIFGAPDGRWAFEPPQAITANVYRCGSEFVLTPLDEMLESKQLYGLVVMDKKEASIGLLKGKALVVLKNMQSQVPQKVNRGGQSQARIQRQADNAVSEWYQMVADAASALFLPRVEKMQGVIVGGPGWTRKEWLNEAKLDYRVKGKVLAETFDTGYTDEYQGLKELVMKAEGSLQGLEVTAERKLLERFFDGVRTGKAAYGQAAVRCAIVQGRAELLLVDSPDRMLEWDPMVYVSNETELGKQFAAMGGVGALLRY